VANQSTDLGSQQAYPHTLVRRDAWGNQDSAAGAGLTKRELFAAMAMQGMLSAGTGVDENDRAAGAVAHADALLAALKDAT
jgi:hypothetical protein